jgi:hypothetical protein
MSESFHGISPTAWIALFTVALTLIAVVQACIYSAMHRTSKVIDRAYVKISHEWPTNSQSPLEFTISEGQPPRALLWFSITIKNEGHTPADVLGGGVWAWALNEELPPTETPDHYPFRIAPAFLTGGGGDFVRERSSVIFPVDLVPHFRDRHNTVGEQLWLIGHVDYRDRFGDFHRAGYCRHLDNASKDLIFDQTTTGLNYDRPLTRPERRKYKPKPRSVQEREP